MRGRAAAGAYALAAIFFAASCASTDYDFSDVRPSSATASTRVAVTNPRFGDRDPHEWKARAPWTYPVHGTDVSKYQREIDWKAAKAGGVSFAFIKATEGGDRLDDYFARNWNATRLAGIPRSAYHFYYFCRPAIEQAQWFIRNVPVDRSALPPVLDMEWNHLSPTCKLRPPAETVKREMRIFLQAIEKHYGKKPIIYTSIDFFDDNRLADFRGYPYWLRSVAGHPSERYGPHPFTFWQYTGTGILPGVTGDADINVFNGSVAEWRKWLAENTR